MHLVNRLVRVLTGGRHQRLPLPTRHSIAPSPPRLASARHGRHTSPEVQEHAQTLILRGGLLLRRPARPARGTEPLTPVAIARAVGVVGVARAHGVATHVVRHLRVVAGHGAHLLRHGTHRLVAARHGAHWWHGTHRRHGTYRRHGTHGVGNERDGRVARQRVVRVRVVARQGRQRRWWGQRVPVPLRRSAARLPRRLRGGLHGGLRRGLHRRLHSRLHSRLRGGLHSRLRGGLHGGLGGGLYGVRQRGRARVGVGQGRGGRAVLAVGARQRIVGEVGQRAAAEAEHLLLEVQQVFGVATTQRRRRRSHLLEAVGGGGLGGRVVVHAAVDARPGALLLDHVLAAAVRRDFAEEPV